MISKAKNTTKVTTTNTSKASGGPMMLLAFVLPGMLIGSGWAKEEVPRGRGRRERLLFFIKYY